LETSIVLTRYIYNITNLPQSVNRAIKKIKKKIFHFRGAAPLPPMFPRKSKIILTPRKIKKFLNWVENPLF